MGVLGGLASLGGGPPGNPMGHAGQWHGRHSPGRALGAQALWAVLLPTSRPGSIHLGSQDHRHKTHTVMCAVFCETLFYPRPMQSAHSDNSEGWWGPLNPTTRWGETPHCRGKVSRPVKRAQRTRPSFPWEPRFLSTVVLSWISLPQKKVGN